MSHVMTDEATKIVKQLLKLWAAPGPWMPGESMEEGLLRLSVPIVTEALEQTFLRGRVSTQPQGGRGLVGTGGVSI